MLFIILKIISLISILIYISVFIYIKFKHPFWFNQPVTQFTSLFNNDGIITNKIPTVINIQNYKITNILINIPNLEKIKKLLDNNYNSLEDYKHEFTLDHLNWTISVPKKNYSINKNNKTNLGIIKDGKLIAFIHSKPIDLYLNERNIPSFYVDYLCIDKKFRKKNIAQSLISHIVKNSLIEYFKVILFKKDIYPLPIKHISKYKSFYISHTNFKKQEQKEIQLVTKLNETNLSLFYKFYLDYLKNFKFYNKFNYEEFKHYLCNENIILYKNKGTNINFMAAFYKTSHKYKEKEVGEFLFLYIPDNFEQILYSILQYQKTNFEYFFVNETIIPDFLIKKYNLQTLSNSYLYFYNYHNNYDLKINDILINIP